MEPLKQKFPLFLFIVFCLSLVVATFYYAPGWGLMDDSQNLAYITQLENDPNVVSTAWKNLFQFQGGFVRPLYQVYLLFTYTLFASAPTFVYFLIIVCNMLALLLWGKVFFSYFEEEQKQFNLCVYLFPLSFFVFTPFWNMFMYISLQEKFLFWFGAISLYYFRKSYLNENKWFPVITLGCIFLSLLSKPTGIYLAILYFCFSFLYLFMGNEKKKLNLVYLIASTVIILSYGWFTYFYQLADGGYSASYKTGLTPSIFIDRVLNGYSVVKVLLGLAVSLTIIYLIRAFKSKDYKKLFPVFFPFSLLLYICLLIPWGIRTYLLCSLAPFMFGALYPVYSWMIKRNNSIRLATNGVLVFLVLCVLLGIVFPRIKKMGEVGQMTQRILQEKEKNTQNMYYLPPPYMEAAYALGELTKESVEYVPTGFLDGSVIEEGQNNFLLVNDQCSGIKLTNARTEDLIYENDTWRMFTLRKELNVEQVVTVDFAKNPMQKLKAYLKSL